MRIIFFASEHEMIVGSKGDSPHHVLSLSPTGSFHLLLKTKWIRNALFRGYHVMS